MTIRVHQHDRIGGPGDGSPRFDRQGSGRDSEQPGKPCHPCGLDRHIDQSSYTVLDGTVKQALEVGKTRLIATGLVLTVAFFAIGVRLVDLTLLQDSGRTSAKHAATQFSGDQVRGDITDRNGVILATSLPTASLFADARLVPDPELAARELHRILPGKPQAELFAKLKSSKQFVWLKRHLTPRQQVQINGLGIPGLNFRREQRRFYPHGALTAHAVGFTSIDNQGLAGVEQSFDELLTGTAEPLQLSLDVRIQHILAEELSGAMSEFRAVGAAGMVYDVRNGEVVAMVSLPSYDPNDAGNAVDDARFNRATLGVYEMGSVFKLFTTAMALDEGVVSVNDGYDTTDPIRAGRFTIRDYKPKKRWLSIPEILIYSSNIGTVHMAMEAGTSKQKAFLSNLGLTRPASFELSEIGRPRFPSKWREINTMTISYGHGISVSPLQLVRAAGALVNGGELKSASLIKRSPDELVTGTRVISKETSRQMRRLMRLVVLHGTGRKANAEGFMVGGKTGTADKLRNGRYVRNARMSSFLGAFPMNDPRYVVFAMIDEPKGTKETHGFATGGWVAAPVIKRLVERMGPLVALEPIDDGADDDRIEQLLVEVQARAGGQSLASQ
ncbi:penicillin-binding protein 2 [Pelagibius sp. Alg239-R121]|uniref:peptidoglycan D,D-transpeptidase FtsI family protein n=1 Tax=Pelagibius sp. Alg239-R121 TaxID=2993448 RepID=UPI0024A73F64|nr:penicillin-binding protein 2 [Pelagibius sp. Alg239-R121]